MHATEELPAIAEPGLAMGRYRLGARIGAGGFGTVYAGHDERLGRPVAVKVIPGDGPAPERAQREARAVARLDHAAIVALFDAGEQDGCRYLVSELVEGRTLAQLEAAGELSDRDVLRIGLALADALAHAHERGVIHRDVKPQNVIVPDAASSRRGAAKLTDFGVAHLAGEEALTLTGDVVGTLAYMAPEQAAGRAVDERADLYALGLVLYEALAGANPSGPARRPRPRGGSAARCRRWRASAPTCRTRCARRSTARSSPTPRRAVTSTTSSTRSPTRCPTSPTKAAGSRRIRSSAGSPCCRPRSGGSSPQRRPAALVWAALAGLTPEPAVQRRARRGRGGRAGRRAATRGLAARGGRDDVMLALGPAPRPGAALLVAALVAGPPLLLRADGRHGRCPRWHPRWACSASPALIRPSPAARRAGRRGSRSGRSALGSWCSRNRCSGAAAQARARRSCSVPQPPPPRPSFDGAAGIAAGDVLANACSSGALLLALIWGAAALVCPWMVRGRSLSADVAGAACWAAAVAVATVTLGEALGDRVAQAVPHGLIPGAVVAAGLALVLAHARRPAGPDPETQRG